MMLWPTEIRSNSTEQDYFATESGALPFSIVRHPIAWLLHRPDRPDLRSLPPRRFWLWRDGIGSATSDLGSPSLGHEPSSMIQPKFPRFGKKRPFDLSEIGIEHPTHSKRQWLL